MNCYYYFDRDAEAFPKFLKWQFCNANKEVRDGVDFLDADKHQSGLQVDFKTSGNKNFYKVILSLLMSMMKHSQSTQSNKFANLYNISKKC